MKKTPSKRNWLVELVLIIAVLAVILILKGALSRTAFLITCFLALVISLAFLFSARFWRKPESFYIFSGVTVIAFIAATMLIYMAKDYTFISGTNPFFALSLVIALAIGLAVTVICYRAMRIPAELDEREKKNRRNKSSKSSLIWVILIAFILSTIFSFLIVESVIEHGNYMFDESEPESVSAKILEKDHVRRRKGRDDYIFTVTVEGKTLELDVPSDDYNSYNVGDTYTFDRYKGGLGEPFYLPDGE